MIMIINSRVTFVAVGRLGVVGAFANIRSQANAVTAAVLAHGNATERPVRPHLVPFAARHNRFRSLFDLREPNVIFVAHTACKTNTIKQSISRGEFVD